MVAQFRRHPEASVAPVGLRRRARVVPVARAARVPLVALAHAWVGCLPTPLDVVRWELVALVVRVVPAPLVVPVVPVLRVVASEVLVVVPVAVLVVVRAPVLVALVAPVAVADLVVSVEVRKRSRVHVGVRSSTSSSHSRQRRTRRALRRCPRASSWSSVVAQHRNSHRN